MGKIFEKLVSLTFQIPVLVAVLLLLNYFVKPDGKNTEWTIMAFLFLSFAPTLYGFCIYRNKTISDQNIINRHERIFPFFIITLIYGINLFLTLIFSGPEIFKYIAINYFLLALVLSCITVFWKISVHVAGITNFLFFLMTFLDSRAIYFLPLIALVTIMIIKSRYHTFWQVFAGMTVGILIAYIALYIHL